MLVWLAEHLVKYYSGFNVFSYLTFRAIVSLLTALFISLWMGPRMIAHLQKLSFGQVVRWGGGTGEGRGVARVEQRRAGGGGRRGARRATGSVGGGAGRSLAAARVL